MHLDLQDAVRLENGPKLAELFSIRSQHNFRQVAQIGNLEAYITRSGWARGPYGVLFSHHLWAMSALVSSQMAEAFQNELTCFRVFLEMFKADIHCTWNLPLFYTLMRNCRELAAKLPHSEMEAKLHQVLDLIRDMFKHVNKNDSIGTLAVCNNMLRIYFKLYLLRNCSNVTIQLEKKGLLDMLSFPRAHEVTYRFFTGRLALLEDNYVRAQADLTFAFANCPSSYFKNKRLILKNLIPVNIIRGRLPCPGLLQDYQLYDFVLLIEAVRTGNLFLFNQELLAHQGEFARMGVYLILEKARLIVYRNFLKKIHRFLALQTNNDSNSNKVPLHKIRAVLAWHQVPMELDEIECILANLIYHNFVKGYLSHTQRTLVVGRDNPFPRLSNLLQQP